MKTLAAALAVTAFATAANAQLWRQFDAATDTPADNKWSNTSPNQAGTAQDFTFTAPASPIAVSDLAFPGITAAYDLAATGPIRGTSWEFFGQNGGGRANFPEVAFEIVFNLDNLTGKHILFEIGGTGAGVSLSMLDDDLVWATNVGGTADPTIGITANDLATGWHQAIAVWNRNTDTTDLYLNGTLVGSAALPAATNGWTGGNEAGLGDATRNTSDTPIAAATYDLTTLTDFDGDIARFNFYRNALDQTAVTDSYNALIPEPGSLALLAAGLTALATRRGKA
ncbi:MAG: LamG-like jellyroll fold domain-containing protein [Planctomycetota bacterium]